MHNARHIVSSSIFIRLISSPVESLTNWISEFWTNYYLFWFTMGHLSDTYLAYLGIYWIQGTIPNLSQGQ